MPAQNNKSTQLLVLFRSKKELKNMIVFWELFGYGNPRHITKDSVLPVPVIAVDDVKKFFFPVNVCCLAAAASQHKRPLSYYAYFTKIANS